MMYYVGTPREWSVVTVITLHWHWPTTLIITKKDYIVIIYIEEETWMLQHPLRTLPKPDVYTKTRAHCENLKVA